MDLAVMRENEIPIALRALRGVVASNGVVTPAEKRFIEVIAELHGTTVQVDALEPIDLVEIARGITEPHQRKRVVQLAVIAAMVEGDPTSAEAAAVDRLAQGLDVDDASLRVLEKVVSHHRLLVRFDLTRRLMGNMAQQAYEDEGIKGVRKMMAIFGGGEDPELAWKYKSLGLLPEGTLGRAFWEHCTRRRFGFPGEKGGFPERLVFHDFGHVLAGYDTDPEGEIQQGAFQAGFVRQDGFAFLLFVVIQFHLGIKVTPVAEGETGLFDVAKVLRAAQRGSACTVDLSDHWNPFDVSHLPLEQVRTQYGIPPL
jgi:hypothetical protein